ncbi:hypothetical protein [Methylomonas sp. AM2-LC]|uniref:hypothetical protein n=1 Tax=Methylomonas sp. AM2-LC TaxID=3153301 RepID=UPI00326328C2
MPGNFLIDPIDFMKNNLVVPHHAQIGSNQADSGIHTMCLVKSSVPARQNGKDVDKWILMKYSSRINPATLGGVFEAYWCPYSQNQTLTCVLNTESRYMFTATMDGCSFGIGSQTGDGACRVAHANESGFGLKHENIFGMDGARQFQRSEQEQRLKHQLGNNIQVINPLNYMADFDGALELKSTTFGYRKAMTWEFYTQKYWKNGGTFFLREVVKQA